MPAVNHEGRITYQGESVHTPIKTFNYTKKNLFPEQFVFNTIETVSVTVIVLAEFWLPYATVTISFTKLTQEHAQSTHIQIILS